MGKSDFFSSLGKKIRAAEKGFTKEMIKQKIKRDGLPEPDEEALEKGSEKIVDEAHRIAKKTGSNVLEELKQAKKEFLKAYREDDEKDG